MTQMKHKYNLKILVKNLSEVKIKLKKIEIFKFYFGFIKFQ